MNLLDPQVWLALITLTSLEIVLGIDNIVIISLLAAKLPKKDQQKARSLGLSLAMIMRILLLLSLNWITHLTEPLFSLFGHPISGRDIVLVGGGLFLIAKSTHEIYESVEGEEVIQIETKRLAFFSIMVQIVMFDIIFSLDNVITAIGMSNQLPIMISAIIIAICFMLFFAGQVSRFIDEHPTLKILALSFLLLIGVMLVVDGFGQHVSKTYIYFAMAFSVFVEFLNHRVRTKTKTSIHKNN